jgi:hypothetical protein
MPTREQVLVTALTKIAEMESFRVDRKRTACQCGVSFDPAPCNYCLMDIHACAKKALQEVGIDVVFKQ